MYNNHVGIVFTGEGENLLRLFNECINCNNGTRLYLEEIDGIDPEYPESPKDFLELSNPEKYPDLQYLIVTGYMTDDFNKLISGDLKSYINILDITKQYGVIAEVYNHSNVLDKETYNLIINGEIVQTEETDCCEIWVAEIIEDDIYNYNINVESELDEMFDNFKVIYSKEVKPYESVLSKWNLTEEEFKEKFKRSFDEDFLITLGKHYHYLSRPENWSHFDLASVFG